MAEQFFKLRKFSLSEGELLTADIEDDYDALNDETFGSSGGGGGGGSGSHDGGLLGYDWEEGHEKFAELVTQGKELLNEAPPAYKPFFDEDDEDLDDRLSDHDDPSKPKWHTKEIVVQSLSQLGMEDDLDDSTITTINRGAQTKPFQSFFQTTAPPALLTAEDCGSPKTRSIWSSDHVYSAPPTQDGRLSNLLKSLQNIKDPITALPVQPINQDLQNQEELNGSQYGGPEMALPTTAFLPNAHRLEDIERNLLEQPPKASDIKCEWASPQTIRAEQLEEELLNGTNPHTLGGFGGDCISSRVLGRGWDTTSETARLDQWSSSPPVVPGTVRTLDEVENDILLKPRAQTVEAVERYLQSGSLSSTPPCVPPPRSSGMGMATSMMISRGPPQPPIGTPPQGSPLLSMMNSSKACSSPGPMSFPPGAGRNSPMLANNHIVAPVQGTTASVNRIYRPPPFPVPPQLPNKRPLMPGVHYMNPMVGPRQNFYPDIERLLYSRQIHHPLLNFPPKPLMMYQQQQPPPQYHPGQFRNEDEYAGLMTSREKDWLIKIQMLQLHTDNPYVDDYYFTKNNMRKLTQQQKKKSNNGEEVKLMLPERVKHEHRTYVPIQYEGSLGKLQVISVNFPRKVLDVHNIAGEDENTRNPANKELHKQRKLLLDIEKLYSVLLDIDDEEKMMCALPQEAHVPHQENREKLMESLFEGLGCCADSAAQAEDRFLRIACIRKGRHLILRALALFHKSQQMEILRNLFQNAGPIVRRDKTDKVLELYLEEPILPLLGALDLAQLLVLGKALCHSLLQASGDMLSKDSTLFIIALHSRFGFSILCTIFERAEALFAQTAEIKNDMQSQWSTLVKLLVKGLIFHQEVYLPEVEVSTGSFWAHLQRLGVQEDQLGLLKTKRTQHLSQSDSNGNSLASH